MRRAAAVLAILAALAGCNAGEDDPTVGTGDEASSSTTAATTATSSTAAPSTTAAAAAATTTTVRAGDALTVLGEGDPASIASAIATSEAAIRDAATPDGDLERHGIAQQAAYRQLTAKQEWLDAVLAGVPAGLHATVRANVAAGADLRALTKPRDALPPWRIVAPAPAEELLGYYKAAEAQLGAPWQYLAAIHLVETRMGRIRGTSTAGAQGPMQFLPATWGQYGAGGDINSNRDSILAAARYLVRNGAPGDMANALFNYNRSDRYVRAVTAYAEQMKADERAYLGYYHWQVYYRMLDGDRLLPVGYGT
jgi:membrane-bound lytic murein transglycosylase B